MERHSSTFQRFLQYITYFDRLVDRVIRVRQADAIARRRAELLNLSLLVLAVVVILTWGFGLIRSMFVKNGTLNPLLGLVLLVLIGISYALNHWGTVRWAANFFLVGLILVISLTIPAGALEPAYLLYGIPLILSGFVQPPGMPFFYAVIAILASAVMALLSAVSLYTLWFPASVLLMMALIIWLTTSRWEKELSRAVHERLELNLRLTQLHDDLPVEFSLEAVTPGNFRNLEAFYKKMGMKKQLAALDGGLFDPPNSLMELWS